MTKHFVFRPFIGSRIFLRIGDDRKIVCDDKNCNMGSVCNHLVTSVKQPSIRKELEKYTNIDTEKIRILDAWKKRKKR